VLAGEGPWGRQLRGEEEMHGRTVVVTLTHERDGARVDRSVVVGFDRTGVVEHLGYTRFPVAVAGEEER
jgi:hypothetical protein